MKYLKNPNDGQVYGYDETDESQLSYLDAAIMAGWEDITETWPPVLDATQLFEQAKMAALQHIETLTQSARTKIVRTADPLEVAAWPNKLRIAQAIKAGRATDEDNAAFQAEINLRGIPGETLKSFADKVVANGPGFSSGACKIDDLKRSARDAIVAATSHDDIDAVLRTLEGSLQNL